MIKNVYLAGALFNAGERLHNLYVEKYLRRLGYNVILPQREAKKFVSETFVDVPAIVEECRRHCTEQGNVFVGCIDGADADSGTCVEFGMAVMSRGAAIVYRTDLRTALEKECGVNAMLRTAGSEVIQQPCYFTDLNEAAPFYEALAQKIHQAIAAKAATLGAP